MFASLFRSNAAAGPSRTPRPAQTPSSETPSYDPPGQASASSSPSSPLPEPIKSSLRSTPRSSIHSERNYIGPDRDAMPGPRTKAQADKYFASIGQDGLVPGRWHKGLAIGGWVFGAFAAGYMVLFMDFGDHEHVFQPIRRQFRAYTRDLITLSPAERSVLGLDGSPQEMSHSDGPLGLEGSLRDARKQPPA